MTIPQWVVVGFVGVGFIGLFVVIVRGQLSNESAIRGMLSMQKDMIRQHDTVLEHLMIASDPDAWRVKQVDKVRKERHAEREKGREEESDPIPRRGVS